MLVINISCKKIIIIKNKCESFNFMVFNHIGVTINKNQIMLLIIKITSK